MGITEPQGLLFRRRELRFLPRALERDFQAQSERYLLNCYHYIELSPVRASMVTRSDEYLWSSYGADALNDASSTLPHQEYLHLGTTIKDRCRAYRELFRGKVDADDLHLIRKAAHYCQPVSDERFREEIVDRYGIEFGQLKRGRLCGEE